MLFCGSPNVVRNGLRGRRQLYKCNDCGRQFLGGKRRDKSQVITDYVEGKQTLDQLALKYGVSERTIRRNLEGMRYVQVTEFVEMPASVRFVHRNRPFCGESFIAVQFLHKTPHFRGQITGTGTAAGKYDLRRLKIGRCGGPW